MSAQTLADRNDIHRSCKALEAVVNVLNDYCEAATAIVAIQKKLAKALRDSASTKVTATIPGISSLSLSLKHIPVLTFPSQSSSHLCCHIRRSL